MISESFATIRESSFDLTRPCLALQRYRESDLLAQCHTGDV